MSDSEAEDDTLRAEGKVSPALQYSRPSANTSTQLKITVKARCLPLLSLGLVSMTITDADSRPQTEKRPNLWSS